MLFEWSTHNEKLRKTRAALHRRGHRRTKFIGFSLPQLRSESGQVMCPYAGDCAQVCYAGQSTFYMPHVKAKYERNLKAVMAHRSKLHERLLEDLQELGRITHVRIHDSGDFFSRWYFEAWMDVARAREDLTIYGYTKSIPFLNFDTMPPNVRLVQSLGGRRDELVDMGRPHSRIFARGIDRREAGYANGNLDDLPVLTGEVKIGLVYHGTHSLKPEHLVLLGSKR